MIRNQREKRPKCHVRLGMTLTLGKYAFNCCAASPLPNSSAVLIALRSALGFSSPARAAARTTWGRKILFAFMSHGTRFLRQ